MKRELHAVLKALRAFSPLDKHAVELLVVELITCERLGMGMMVSVDPEHGFHLVTVEVFPEATDEAGNATDKIWRDIVHSFSFCIERGETHMLMKLRVECRMRRTAFAYHRWAVSAGVVEQVVPALPGLGVLAGSGEPSDSEGSAERGNEQGNAKKDVRTIEPDLLIGRLNGFDHEAN